MAEHCQHCAELADLYRQALAKAREAGSRLAAALNKLGEYVEDDNPGRAVADAWTAGLLEAAGRAIREWAELDAAAAQRQGTD